jgi:hypothetical protein
VCEVVKGSSKWIKPRQFEGLVHRVKHTDEHLLEQFYIASKSLFSIFYATEQGISDAYQGKYCAEQGIFTLSSAQND